MDREPQIRKKKGEKEKKTTELFGRFSQKHVRAVAELEEKRKLLAAVAIGLGKKR
jgi:hypothetical protein